MIQERPKVSVIIPVYNTEKYLTQCLESICAQTEREIEIICVNDGSTDRSAEILETFKEKDSRLRVLDQKNLFAGTARNMGLKYASGEFLVFWDSDDFFYENALQTMLEKITADQADICVCGADEFYEEMGGIRVPSSSFVKKNFLPDTIPFNRESNPNYILNFTGFATWNKMYRRSFIEDNLIRFQETRTANDIFFSICAMCLAKRITIAPNHLLCYRKNRPDSLVGGLWKTPLTPFHAMADARKYLICRDAFPEQSFVNKAARNIIYVLNNISSSATAFNETVDYLKREGLSRLGLQGRNSDYFYNPRDALVISHLEKDSIQEFAVFFLHDNYLRLSEVNAKKAVIQEKNRKRNKQMQKKIASLENQLNLVTEKNEDLAKQLRVESKNNLSLSEKLLASRDENKILSKQLNAERAEISAIQASISYRIGFFLTWLPRMVRDFFKK